MATQPFANKPLISRTSNESTMKGTTYMKRMLNKVIVIGLGTVGAVSLIAASYYPHTTNKDASCNCGANKNLEPCTFYESSQNTLCECGATCCEDIGSPVPITLKTATGYCRVTGCDGTLGSPTNTTGQAKTSACPED